MSFLSKNLYGFIAGASIPIFITKYFLIPIEHEGIKENQSELAFLRSQIRTLSWDVKLLEAHTGKAFA